MLVKYTFIIIYVTLLSELNHTTKMLFSGQKYVTYKYMYTFTTYIKHYKFKSSITQNLITVFVG